MTICYLKTDTRSCPLSPESFASFVFHPNTHSANDLGERAGMKGLNPLPPQPPHPNPLPRKLLRQMLGHNETPLIATTCGGEGASVGPTCVKQPGASPRKGLEQQPSRAAAKAIAVAESAIVFALAAARPFLVCLFVAVAACQAMAQTPELIVEIDKREVYEGESVLYRVTLNHVENPTEPKLEGFDDFRITPLAQQSLNSQRVTIINGVRSEVVRRGRQYNFQLTPLRSGELTIPAPTAKVGADLLKGREIDIRVIPPDDQDVVLLELAVDRDAVYPMQPFTLTLTVVVKELPGDEASRDPLSVQPTPPTLNVPWLDDNQIPNGITTRKSWREILEPLVSRRGNGVQINQIGSSSVFSLFDRAATGFRPEPKRTTRPDRDGNEIGYWEYPFRRTFVPQRIGQYDFGPVSIKGTFATDVKNRKLVGNRIYAVAKSLSVEVQDVPQNGRPDSYIGAIGSFDVAAQLAPTSARVGDPMTLTLTLSGTGTLADARPPVIASLPGVEGAFRTYDATEETDRGTRRFTYSLRPLSTDVSQFPSIPVAYFDSEQERYVTVETEPIGVTIREAETLSSTDIVSTPGSSNGEVRDFQRREGGVFANDSDWKSLRNETVHPGRWLALWGGMIGCYVVLTFAINLVRRRRADPGMVRIRQAPSHAQKALKVAASAAAAGDERAACETLRQAIIRLVADFANVPEVGLTPGDIGDRLDSLGVDDELRARTLEFLNACDAASYGACAEGLSQLDHDAHDIVDHLTSTLKKRDAVRLARSCCSLPACFVRMAAGNQQTSIPRGNFRKPNRLLPLPSRATTSCGPRASISRSSIRASCRVPFSTTKEIPGFEQAKRAGQSPPIGRQNAIGREIPTSTPTSKVPSPPPAMPRRKQPSHATYSFGKTGSAIKRNSPSRPFYSRSPWWHPCYAPLGPPSDPPRMSLTAALLTLLLAISTAWDWHRFDQTTHGVVTSDQVTVRKGNSTNYEPAFTEPFDEGTEFVTARAPRRLASNPRPRRRDWLAPSPRRGRLLDPFQNRSAGGSDSPPDCRNANRPDSPGRLF